MAGEVTARKAWLRIRLRGDSLDEGDGEIDGEGKGYGNG